MLRPITLAALVVLGLITHRAEAQVVQLPTFEMFGIGTTVRVPVGGSMVLGGMNGSGASRAGRGAAGPGRFPGIGRPFGSRSTASSLSAGSARATVTVHDFERMDQMLLSQAARHGSRIAERQQQANRPNRGLVLGDSSAERPALGLAEIRRQTAVDARAKESQALRLIDRASAAQSQGKYALAKMVYRMAAKKTDDEQLRRRISNLMATVTPSRNEARVAKRR